MAKRSKKKSVATGIPTEYHVANIDGGNGSVIAVRTTQPNGDPLWIDEGVARLNVTGQNFQRGDDFETVNRVYHWRGLDYLVGTDIRIGDQSRIDEDFGLARYGGEHHLMNIAVGLTRLYPTGSDMPIALGVSVPSHIKVNRPDICDSIIKNIGDTLTIGMSDLVTGERTDYVFNIAFVYISEETVSMRGLMLLTNCGDKANGYNDRRKGRIFVLDIGSLTAQMGVLTNGKYEGVPQMNDNLGLRMGLHKVIRDSTPALKGVALSQIDDALFMGTSVRTPEGEFEIGETAKQGAYQAYGNGVFAEMSRMGFRASDFKGAVIFGGGANAISPYFENKVNMPIVNHQVLYDIDDNIPYQVYTSLGALRIMLYKIRNGELG